MPLIFRAAKLEEHKALLQISKQHKCTKDFSNQMMFSSEDAYRKGWIRVVESMTVPNGERCNCGASCGENRYHDRYESGCADFKCKILGFSCVRIKKREPEVVLYFLGVDRDAQRQGLGWKLIEDFMDNAPRTHRLLRLNVLNTNEQAIAFYMKHGFEIVGPALKGTGTQLTKLFPEPVE